MSEKQESGEEGEKLCKYRKDSVYLKELLKKLTMI